jgi:meso-butanediol dehydrogenase / (S,S)-butanediol dehydrogenase / diacetyl reductase
MLLTEKVLFLTGGSSGIGYSCFKAYAQQGAMIAVVSNNEIEIENILSELDDGRHLGILCDVSSEIKVKSALEKTIQYYGKLDAIHNNAGIVHPNKMLHATTTDEWNKLIDINLKSVYLTAKYGFDELVKSKGSILNTSSLVGDIGQDLHAVYSATKGGMNALTKSMALDYAKFKIRVNAVCPAWVMTPVVQQWIDSQNNIPQILNSIASVHPLGYCPEGDVVADACVFLLSEKARFITGCTLPISGGAELGYRQKL